jgi:Ca2+-binding RTX toxin-like protein
MAFRRTTRFALAASVALAAAGASATGAQAATTCKFANAVVEVHMTEHRDSAGFAVAEGTIGIGGEKGTVTCAGGTPTTRTTDTVLIIDDSDNIATPAGNDGNISVYVSEPKAFGPGKTHEPFSASEIEFLADPKGGNDLLVAGGADSQGILVGNDGANWSFDDDADLIGMPFDDISLYGRSSSDSINGQGGRGTGAPLSTAKTFKVDTNGGSDYVLGSDIPGGDVIDVDDGDDTIDGGAGDDLLSGWSGNDTIKGGAGNDTVRFDRGAAPSATVDLAQTRQQDTGEGMDTLAELENVRGSMGPDRLSGTSGVNVLDGGVGGDDTLEGRGGADDLRGGAGSDAVSYAQAPASVSVDLARTTQATDGDKLNSIEDVIGSPFADTLTGNAEANRIVGGAGTDTVAAAAGADRVEVRDGEGDRVSCGADADTAVSDRRTLDALDADCETVDALPEPEPQTGGGQQPDTTLGFTLAGAERQRLVRQGAIRVRLKCPLEACTAVVSASGRVRGTKLLLRPRTVAVAAGSARTAALRLSRKQRRVLRAALAADKRPRLTVTAEARDAAGNRVRQTLRVTAKR